MGGIIGKKKKQYDDLVLDKRHFNQERCIGAGGFGKVHACFKASPPEEGRLFAMKTLDKQNIFKNKNGVSEVMDEMHLLSTVMDPFVCNIYYAFQDPWSLYLVMDLAKGGDLRYRMKQWKQDKKKYPINPEEHVKFFISNIILALEYLHKNHILHRDLKPENYILEESGYVLLTDFGIADAMVPGEDICVKSSGTNGYMAPEVYNSSRKHTFTADYFSLGVSLYELLENKRPFTKDFIIAKSKGLLSWDKEDTSPPDHQGLKMGASEEARSFVAALLQFNPYRRLGAKEQLQEMKQHEWFKGFDWEGTKAKTVQPPFIPNCTNANCDSADLDMAEMFVENQKPPPPPEEQQVLLQDYHFSHLGTRPDGSSIATVPLEEFNNTETSIAVRSKAAQNRRKSFKPPTSVGEEDETPDAGAKSPRDKTQGNAVAEPMEQEAVKNEESVKA